MRARITRRSSLRLLPTCRTYEIRDEFNPADYEEEGGQREQSGEEEVDFGVAELGFEGGEVLWGGGRGCGGS